jgi:hypothetical protein
MSILLAPWVAVAQQALAANPPQLGFRVRCVALVGERWRGRGSAKACRVAASIDRNCTRDTALDAVDLTWLAALLAPGSASSKLICQYPSRDQDRSMLITRR